MAEEEDINEDSTKPILHRKNKKRTDLLILIVVVLLAIAFFAIKDNWMNINPPEKEPVTPVLSDADVVLYKFDSLSNNKTTNIEAWLMNIGDKTATNITVHVRSRTQNGTVLYDDTIKLSALVLRANETCTGDYTVNFPVVKSKHLYHTIEVSWDNGRHTYARETD